MEMVKKQNGNLKETFALFPFEVASGNLTVCSENGPVETVDIPIKKW